MSIQSLHRIEGDLRYDLRFNPHAGLGTCPRCHNFRRLPWAFECRERYHGGETGHEILWRSLKTRYLCVDCGKAAERYCRGGAA